MEYVKYSRKSVPKTLKDSLWDTTFGSDKGNGNCYVCNIIINSKRFEAGHIVAVHNKGSTTLDNLECICSTCNKSMGVQNLEDFKGTYFPARKYKIPNKKSIDYDKSINDDMHTYTCNNIPTDIYDELLGYKLLSLDKFKFTQSLPD